MKQEIKENYSLYLGDNIQWLKTLPSDSVDSVVTDPPYGLTSIVKRFGKSNSKDAQYGTDGVFKRSSKGFMGKEWDADVPSVEFWEEVYRILKPGGHILSFGGTRTYHRMATAIEDAGFEIRDQLQWLFFTGFPKSHNIGKAIDKRTDWSQYDNFKKMLKKRREELGLSQLKAYIKCKFPSKTFGGNSWFENGKIPSKKDYLLIKEGLLLDDKFDALFEEVQRELVEVKKNSDSKGTIRFTGYGDWKVTKGNSEWEKWGTALKPANEPICLARKPLSERTIAENVLRHGTGGINIDDCRIPFDMTDLNPSTNPLYRHQNDYKMPLKGVKGDSPVNFTSSNNNPSELGRFPSNVLIDESIGEILDEQGGIKNQGHWSTTNTNGFGEFGGGKSTYYGTGEKDKSKIGASKFFYVPKPSKKEKSMGLDQTSNSHPTVKPITLISYLVRLITPPGGTVLDPYMGSGSGGISTLLEGFKFIGMDQDPEYFEIAKERIKNYESYREILVKQQKPKQHQYVPREEDSIKKPVISFWLNQAI